MKKVFKQITLMTLLAFNIPAFAEEDATNANQSKAESLDDSMPKEEGCKEGKKGKNFEDCCKDHKDGKHSADCEKHMKDCKEHGKACKEHMKNKKKEK